MRRRQNSAPFTDCSINYHPCGVGALSYRVKDGTYLIVLYFVCKGKRAEQVGATELEFFRLYIEKMCLSGQESGTIMFQGVLSYGVILCFRNISL